MRLAGCELDLIESAAAEALYHHRRTRDRRNRARSRQEALRRLPEAR
jgi:hypothetical protein